MSHAATAAIVFPLAIRVTSFRILVACFSRFYGGYLFRSEVTVRVDRVCAIAACAAHNCPILAHWRVTSAIVYARRR